MKICAHWLRLGSNPDFQSYAIEIQKIKSERNYSQARFI